MRNGVPGLTWDLSANNEAPGHARGGQAYL